MFDSSALGQWKRDDEFMLYVNRGMSLAVKGCIMMCVSRQVNWDDFLETGEWPANQLAGASFTKMRLKHA